MNNVNTHILFNNSEFRKHYYKYYNLKKKWLLNNGNIWFNKECKKNNIIPKYATIKNKAYSNPSWKSKKQYSLIRINNELKFLYFKKHNLALKLYHQELCNMKFFGHYWHNIKQNMLEKLSTFVKKKYEDLNHKLRNLSHRNVPIDTVTGSPSFQFQNPVKNLTEINFNQNELSHIEKAYKSNFQQPKLNSQIDTIIAEVEHIIQSSNNEDKNSIKFEIKQQLEKHIQNNNNQLGEHKTFNHKTMRQVLQKVKDNNLTIGKADKGNIITIDSKDNIIQKTNTFLENPIYMKLKSDPTARFQKQLKDQLKQCKIVIPQERIKTLINPNPKAPMFRSTTKLHKENYPIRPIVNYTPAPAYRTKKFLNKQLNESLIIENKYNIKNTGQLIQELQKIKINPNIKIISLDIENMYTNIPIQETLNIIKSQMESLLIENDIIQQTIGLLNTALKQNYFSFNSEFFQQIDGLPMGSPLSSLLADIFLQHLETTHIQRLKDKHNILYYGRFVDDIIIIYENPADISSNILQSFNDIHEKIKYTLEVENGNTLNFLDITVRRHQTKFTFNIFRKPTTSKNSIHNQSYYPDTYKWANFRHLLNRLNTTPLNKINYKKEFNTIKEIALHNNFSIHDVHKLNNKIKMKLKLKTYTTLQHPKKDNNQSWYPLTYRKNLSENIKTTLKKHGINISHKIRNNYKYRLINKPCTNDKMNNSGIYKLNCTCGTCYIGRTTRKFKERLKEHRNSFKYNYPEKSKFSAHLLENGHPFGPDNETFEIVKIVNNKNLIDILEQLEIYKTSKVQNVVNEQFPNFDNPLFHTRLKIT